MRPFSLFRAVLALVPASVVVGCGPDALVAPGTPGRVFDLVLVDGEPLPYVYEFGAGRFQTFPPYRLTVHRAELLLRLDFTAMLVRRVQRLEGESEWSGHDSTLGFWDGDDSSLRWCPNVGARWGECTGGPVTDGYLTVRSMTGGEPAREFLFRER